ncbi:MAG: putative toxin-antitoxin system toxin component, PIN family [Rickettsiales bacterium]
MTNPKYRVVIDTNFLISRVLTPDSLISSALRFIIQRCDILVSQATMDEFIDVLNRFERRGYINQEEIINLVNSYKNTAQWIPIIRKIQACRDPKDNKFLELAVAGAADYIITGDKDLLTLHPFEGVSIVKAKDFIAGFVS